MIIILLTHAQFQKYKNFVINRNDIHLIVYMYICIPIIIYFQRYNINIPIILL